MKCKKCGSPLPSEGVACKFCGILMDQEQINYRNKMNNKNNDKTVRIISAIKMMEIITNPNNLFSLLLRYSILF